MRTQISVVPAKGVAVGKISAGTGEGPGDRVGAEAGAAHSDH